MGKTTLSHALAKILGLSYQRIQFTSDLLPGDILGTSVFDRDSGQFTFHPGPIFAELVLADEINRATPKSQSALLEAMEEGQVSIEGATRLLPDPFFVIATQNPFSSGGTFALPEVIRPEPQKRPCCSVSRVANCCRACNRFWITHCSGNCSDALVDYVLRLADATRSQPLCLWAVTQSEPGDSGGGACLGHVAGPRLRDSRGRPSVVGHRLRERSDPTRGMGGRGALGAMAVCARCRYFDPVVQTALATLAGQTNPASVADCARPPAHLHHADAHRHDVRAGVAAHAAGRHQLPE